MNALTVDDMDNLRHMLGITETTPHGYRNYFVAGGADVASMERLCEHGLAKRNTGYILSDDRCYNATEKAAAFLGLRKLPQ